MLPHAMNGTPPGPVIRLAHRVGHLASLYMNESPIISGNPVYVGMAFYYVPSNMENERIRRYDSTGRLS